MTSHLKKHLCEEKSVDVVHPSTHRGALASDIAATARRAAAHFCEEIDEKRLRQPN